MLTHDVREEGLEGVGHGPRLGGGGGAREGDRLGWRGAVLVSPRPVQLRGRDHERHGLRVHLAGVGARRDRRARGAHVRGEQVRRARHGARQELVGRHLRHGCVPLLELEVAHVERADEGGPGVQLYLELGRGPRARSGVHDEVAESRHARPGCAGQRLGVACGSGEVQHQVVVEKGGGVGDLDLVGELGGPAPGGLEGVALLRVDPRVARAVVGEGHDVVVVSAPRHAHELGPRRGRGPPRLVELAGYLLVELAPGPERVRCPLEARESRHLMHTFLYI